MARDIFKTAEQATINKDYELNFMQLRQLVHIATDNGKHSENLDNIYKVIDIAFKYGYVMGSKAEQDKLSANK